jgi:asparagine synthase (glutamine-hydrolysing)
LPAESDLNSALFYNTFSYGLEELLRLADRNSMASSVEVRLPFLSHELIEFLFTLPPGFKIKDGWTKWLLRKIAKPILPKEIVWRKDKIGFEPPQKLWMENTNVQEAIISGKKLLVDKGILNPSFLSSKIQPHDAHAADNRDWKYWSASFLYT